MCGILFLEQHSNQFNLNEFIDSLKLQSWRGPDNSTVESLSNGRFYLGHNRLAIIDTRESANQPMFSIDMRFAIIFNGEIYNHKKLRNSIGGKWKTESDTETILNGYIKYGEDIFNQLDGMFSILILDIKNATWLAARDPFGIKPLFYKNLNGGAIVSSEPISINKLSPSEVSLDSIVEWRSLRRPIPGYSFFEGVKEVMPGCILHSNGKIEPYYQKKASLSIFSQEEIEGLIENSVNQHELSDVKNVALLSGGLDSGIIAALSHVKKFYTVGLESENEFEGAEETAKLIGGELVTVVITPKELESAWRELIKLRGEPLGVPNEGLIYAVCSQMAQQEKVVLTGEGADELFFGYNRIFEWAKNQSGITVESFLEKYTYNKDIKISNRMHIYLEGLLNGKSPIEFVEDFFYEVHLTGLLRRMDFASMAASKETRVPFVCKNLVNYLYRKNPDIKIKNGESKIPLRILAKKLGLTGALNRPKIGFKVGGVEFKNMHEEYEHFQNFNIEVLGW